MKKLGLKTLTQNEITILEMLKSQTKEKDIAKKMNVSLHTIKSHVHKFSLLGLL